MEYCDVYIDGHYVGTVQVGSGSYYGAGGGLTLKQWINVLLPIALGILWPALAVITALVFFLTVLPSVDGLGAALLEGSHIVVLFLVSLFNIAMMIVRAVFKHRLKNSSEEKYVKLRRAISEAESAEDYDFDRIIDEDDKVFLKESASPIAHGLSVLRSVLFIVMFNMMAVTLAFPTSAIGTTVMVFAYPLFAYGYVLSLVNSYISYGKSANYCWLFLFAAIVVGYFLMSIPGAESIAEYIVLCTIILFHGLGDRFVLKRIAKKQG